MKGVVPAYSLVVVLCAMGSIVPANAQPAPGASQAKAPCASPPESYADVFGTPVDDAAVLRFIRQLSLAAPAVQRQAIAALRTPVEDKTAAAVDGAEEQVPCSAFTVENVKVRMGSAVNAAWTITNDADATKLDERLAIVARALVGRRFLDAAILDALLSPFGSSVAALEAPQPAAPAPCTAPDSEARTLRLTQPAYPAPARAAGTTGTVRIKVEVDADGAVERAVVFSDTVGDRIGGDGIRTAALFAAATTAYAPAVRACVPVRGSYLFRADFTSRRR